MLWTALSDQSQPLLAAQASCRGTNSNTVHQQKSSHLMHLPYRTAKTTTYKTSFFPKGVALRMLYISLQNALQPFIYRRKESLYSKHLVYSKCFTGLAWQKA